MLAPRHIIFTALEGALLDPHSKSWAAAVDGLEEIARRRVPIVIAGSGTRAQIDPLRRKIEHSHPFITENGGGLFLPDGYFALRLEGAARVARYFCVPFGRPYAEAAAAVQEIAALADAAAVGYAQMSIREIANNTHQSQQLAELDREREFSERFFFAGETDASIRRFAEIAAERKWTAVPGDPFWELYSGNDEGLGLRYLMKLYRAGRARLTSVAIGSSLRDLPLLAAADHAIVLPCSGKEFAAGLTDRLSRGSKATLGDAPGPEGWSRAVLDVLKHD
jgi:mannosyl-3-phosphoglycerate phosphatase